MALIDQGQEPQISDPKVICFSSGENEKRNWVYSVERSLLLRRIKLNKY